MDALFLSRVQFAMTSAFHYIYPPLSIGLGLLLVIVEGIYIRTRDPLYKKMTKFWVQIFALTFALGVATGLVQLFGFGTNWSRYSRFVGDVFGSALGAEGIFAFFLEAGFLGVMLFGWERVSARVHYLSTILVAIGAHFSSLWIVIANSWMQTPAGYKIVMERGEPRAVITDFWQMALNSSTLDRISHVILGCWLSGFFLAISISAYYILKKKHIEFSMKTLRISLYAAFTVLILQLISGDSSARGVAIHQPAKLAAMEGIYKTESATPLTVFGWVDEKEERVKGLQIPGMLSLFVHRDFQKPVKGLEEIAKEDRPPVQPVFQAYHLMIAMWGLMAAATFFALLLLRKNRLSKEKLLPKWLLTLLIASVGFPQIANQAGWMTAEIGRQPWIVYGVLRTTQGVTPGLERSHVLASLIMLATIYIILLFTFLFLLDRKIKAGPKSEGNENEVYHKLYVAEEQR